MKSLIILSLRKGLVLLILLTSLIVSSCILSSDADLTTGKNLFNDKWEFVRDVNWSIDKIMGTDGQALDWRNVKLPHSANIEPLIIKGQQWQGDCIYKKEFKLPKTYKGKHLALYFEGAMQVAEVYLNGKLLKIHYGGYLPFYIDISDYVDFSNKNQLVVKLNNVDNVQFAPGKALGDLDFNIYSGLYRNVWLVIKEPLHIVNPVEIDQLAAGVLVSYSNVTRNNARVHVKLDLKNDSPKDLTAGIEVKLMDGTEKVANVVSEPQSVKANNVVSVEMILKVNQPKLWSPDNPQLYQLAIEVILNDKVLDKEEFNIGIRDVEISAEKGFVLNGKPLKIRGTNRHQEYPYVGYAISDNANYRDAWKIKEAGFNFVRLSHYPQTQSFLNACDELGILVMDAIPGWQFFGNEQFQLNALDDVRQMVRLDRNHPSVVLWEASLNESQMDSAFMLKAHAIVKEELPGSPAYTSGWMDFAYDVFIPARQHSKAPDYWNKYSKDKPLLIAEYGDWEYYAQNAGFNQKAFGDLSEEERNSRQLRGYGQKRLTQQALNYQESHNSNLKGNAIGDANWLMFDYNRGYAPDIESSGIMDIFRLPKFSYYFYKSQVDIHSTSDNTFSKPMVAIANYYNDPSFMEVKVYSNCDEVELMVNGQSVAKQTPDIDQNCTHIKHPPFTFHLPAFVPGHLTAKGYVKREVVVETEQQTPGQEYGLKLWIDESGKPLQSACNDIVFAYAAVVDKEGTILPQANNVIRFEVEGDGELVGKNPIRAEAGISTVLLRAGERSGHLSLKAMSEGLESTHINIEVKE